MSHILKTVYSDVFLHEMIMFNVKYSETPL